MGFSVKKTPAIIHEISQQIEQKKPLQRGAGEGRDYRVNPPPF